MHKLALHGGKPEVDRDLQRFDHPLFVRSYELSRLSRADPVDYNGGGINDELEKAWASWSGTKYSLSFNSGTSALYALYYANGLMDKAEVIVPAYGFFATATPLVRLGAKLVFADCNEHGNVDPTDVLRKISSRTRAIVVTHMWGVPCDMDALRAIADTARVLLLEDASHAHGALYKGRIAGSLADGAAWSVGAKKNISGGQGGMLSTNDRLVFEKAILLGHYNRHKGTAITIPDLRPYAVSGTGLNLRMHPYAALMVLDQLPGYQLQLQERTEVATLVASRLRGLAGIKVPATPPDVQPSWYAFPFFLDLSNLGLSTQFSREWVLAALHAEGAVEYDAPGSTAPQNKYKFLTEQISDEVGDTSMIAAEQYSRTAMKMPVWYGPRRFEYAEQYAAALTKVMSHLSELTRGPASASELAGST